MIGTRIAVAIMAIALLAAAGAFEPIFEWRFPDPLTKVSIDDR